MKSPPVASSVIPDWGATYTYATNEKNDKPGSKVECAEFVAKSLDAGKFILPNISDRHIYEFDCPV